MLKDKVAIVTGGSRGIGKAIAEALLREGSKVVIGARSKREINKTVKELSSWGEIIGITVDVSKFKEVHNLVLETLEKFRSLNILINAAGIQGPIGPVFEVKTGEWIHNIQVNLIGTMLCCKEVLPTFVSQRRGKIINFSGGGATSPRPNFSAYACSKAAVVRFTETLADEVRQYGIDVNVVAPGAVNTRMLDEILKAGKVAGEELNLARDRKSHGGTSPELAAELVVFLASDASNGLTGKLVSAPHDDWKGWDSLRIKELMSGPWFTLRRIDSFTLDPLKHKSRLEKSSK
jgi:NAD(P)-dependent dehydrogenase (short-subunit alcohol dehydrogenase family)